jgi:formate dehydrogenase iron-sulfur subunit
MSVTVYVPRDSGALALGAEKAAKAIAREAAARGLEAKVVRNGSRGLYWLEPMVEVATGAGRIAYGPVSANDVPSLFDAGFLTGGAHPLALSRPEAFLSLRSRPASPLRAAASPIRCRSTTTAPWAA